MQIVIFAGVHSQFQFPSSRNTADEKRGKKFIFYILVIFVLTL